MQHQRLLTIQKGDSWLVCPGIAAAAQSALLAFSAPNMCMELNDWVLLCAAKHQKAKCEPQSKQAFALWMWVMLCLLDCMVRHLCKSQCPADSMIRLQYLHCQQQSTVWTKEYASPCDTYFATVPLHYKPANLHAMHSSTVSRQFCLMMSKQQKLLWCQS